MSSVVNGILDKELRRQQLRFSIFKASRVLLSRQEFLRQVLSQRLLRSLVPPQEQTELPSGEEETTEPPNTILQQLMVAATQPSPLKPVFTKEELEVSPVFVTPLDLTDPFNIMASLLPTKQIAHLKIILLLV